MNNAEISKKWAEIVAKAWTDEKFKKELISSPEKILNQYGIKNPKGHFKVVENTKNQHYLILPEKPTEVLSEEELKKRAAAGGICAGLCLSACF